MTISPKKIHPIPTYSKTLITSPSTPTPNKSALIGIRNVTNNTLVAPAAARIRKYSKYANAVLIKAIPKTAATACNEGLNDQGESIIKENGNIIKLEHISIPAELTTGDVYFSLLPNIPDNP